MKDDILSQSLDYVRSLPPTAAEWDHTIPEFLKKLSEIRDARAEDRLLMVAVDDAIAVVTQDFSAEFEFFQRDTASWAAEKLLPNVNMMKKAQDIIEELYQDLAEYEKIFKVGSIFSEEKIRRRERNELESRLLKRLDDLDRLMGMNQEPVGKKKQQPTGRDDQPSENQIPAGRGVQTFGSEFIAKYNHHRLKIIPVRTICDCPACI